LKYTALDAEQLKGMLMAGAASLAAHKEEINGLNVFPVPDGDTGTNMNLTVESANREMSKEDVKNINDVTHALTKGSLMGARGNSGVILSQIFRGIARGLADNREITPAVLASALQMGADTAYKAVIKPVEGTILTVAKNAARIATQRARADSINELMQHVLTEALRTLEYTPELLPVLKQAGVVDAGGKGLCYIFEGWSNYLEGRVEQDYSLSQVQQVAPASQQPTNADLRYNYCTEFIAQGEQLSEEVFRHELEKHGDSLVVVGADDIIKVHVHTDNPGLVLDFALSQGGELQDIKIDNMKFQHTEMVTSVPSAGEEDQALNGAVAVAAGSGLKGIFESMGVNYVILGGQTMNPSTEDFLQAIKDVAAERIIILPNNGNVLMAAQQAAEVADRPVSVIPTKTIPQGLAAMLNFSSDEQDFSQLEEMMNSAIDAVKTGQITYAVRDSVFDGKPIAQGNILGIADGQIVAVEESIKETTMNLVEEMLDDESEIITLFYGEDMSSQDAEDIASDLESSYPDCEIELHSGGQPLYYFIIAIE